MRHAGALRVDHVLGLARLFWVPEGAEGRDGAYVAYPLKDLLGVLALESQRARCLVIGEDLGTVAEGLREALDDHGIYSYRVLPFEQDGDRPRAPQDYPVGAMACVSTHDLPPLAGWWQGSDLEERYALGLMDTAGLAQAKAQRGSEKAALLLALAEAGLGADWTPEDALGPALAGAIHEFIARSPSRLMVAQIDDLAGETVGVNLPGTDRERPNWRRKIETPVADLMASEIAIAILEAIARERPVS
jgi:glycogen operon protein